MHRVRAALKDVAQLQEVALLSRNKTVFRIEADMHGAELRREAIACRDAHCKVDSAVTTSGRSAQMCNVPGTQNARLWPSSPFVWSSPKHVHSRLSVIQLKTSSLSRQQLEPFGGMDRLAIASPPRPLPTPSALWAPKPIISRRKSASALFSISPRRAMISSVILSSLVRVGVSNLSLPKIVDDHPTSARRPLRRSLATAPWGRASRAATLHSQSYTTAEDTICCERHRSPETPRDTTNTSRARLNRCKQPASALIQARTQRLKTKPDRRFVNHP